MRRAIPLPSLNAKYDLNKKIDTTLTSYDKYVTCELVTWSQLAPSLALTCYVLCKNDKGLTHFHRFKMRFSSLVSIREAGRQMF